MDPQKYCHDICKKSGSNFVTSFYLLGKKRRGALEAFYAFCRLLDDSVDEASNPEIARQKIQFWRDEVYLIYNGHPRHMVSQALIPVVKEFEISKKYFEEIVKGCEMDLIKKTYASFRELEEYCFRVASCVGLVSLHIFGVPLLVTTEQGAIALGKALQLTNILRDIVSDLRRERIYIPQEDLKHFEVSPADLSGKSGDDLNRVDLLYFEIARARQFFKEAWDAFPKTPQAKRQLIAANLMGRFYEAILNKIEKDPLVVFQGKVSLTKGEKFKIAAVVLLDAYLS